MDAINTQVNDRALLDHLRASLDEAWLSESFDVDLVARLNAAIAVMVREMYPRPPDRRPYSNRNR